MWYWLGPNKRRLRPDAVPTIFGQNNRLSNNETQIITDLQNTPLNYPNQTVQADSIGIVYKDVFLSVN